ncbi:hypothetical protein N9U59_01615 [Gammaproteobacteria bacterium]|nr:hypothetical protein [Gammaproteobacteria bacterium]
MDDQFCYCLFFWISCKQRPKYIYAGKMTDTDINEHKAKEISDEVDDFESRA